MKTNPNGLVCCSGAASEITFEGLKLRRKVAFFRPQRVDENRLIRLVEALNIVRGPPQTKRKKEELRFSAGAGPSTGSSSGLSPATRGNPQLLHKKRFPYKFTFVYDGSAAAMLS